MKQISFYKVWLPISLVVHVALLLALSLVRIATVEAVEPETIYTPVTLLPDPPTATTPVTPLIPEQEHTAQVKPRGVQKPHPTRTHQMSEYSTVPGPGEGANLSPAMLTSPHGLFKAPTGNQEGLGTDVVGEPNKPTGISEGASFTGKATAVYPKEALEEGIEGDVEVTVAVSAHGGVDTVSITQAADSLLNKAALSTARAMHFRPAQKNGVPVAATITLRFTFAHGKVEATTVE